MFTDTPSPLKGLPHQRPFGSTPDALHGVASFIEREWGHYGYRLTPTGLTHPADDTVYVVWEVRSSDGAYFHVGVDAYGNARFIGSA